MAIAIRQTNGWGAGGGIIFPLATIAGNTIIALVVTNAVGVAAGVADDAGDSFTKVVERDCYYYFDVRKMSIWVAPNIAAHAANEAVNGQTNCIVRAAYEVSGLANPPYDTNVQSDSGGGMGTDVLTGSYTPGQASEFLLTFLETYDACSATNNTTGWTKDVEDNGGIAHGLSRVVSSIGTYQESITLSASRYWFTILAGFKGVVAPSFAPILARNFTNPMCARNVSEGSING